MTIASAKTPKTKSYVTNLVIIIFIIMIIMFMSDMSTARKSMRRGRGKMRKQNSLRIIGLTGLKRRELFNNTDGAYIVKASHFDQEYSLGHKITLICLARGNPRPRITWMKDLVEVVSHPFLQITEWHQTENEIKSKFEIDPARQMDAGAYSCQANNKYAVDQKHFKVDF